MRLGLVVSSDDPETVWNAFRLGIFALKQGDSVKAFLIARGVEAERRDTERFKVTEQMKAFAEAGGIILACGTCLKLRQSEGSALCPISTLKDLHELVKESDRVVSF